MRTEGASASARRWSAGGLAESEADEGGQRGSERGEKREKRDSAMVVPSPCFEDGQSRLVHVEGTVHESSGGVVVATRSVERASTLLETKSSFRLPPLLLLRRFAHPPNLPFTKLKSTLPTPPTTLPSSPLTRVAPSQWLVARPRREQSLPPSAALARL